MPSLSLGLNSACTLTPFCWGIIHWAILYECLKEGIPLHTYTTYHHFLFEIFLHFTDVFSHGFNWYMCLHRDQGTVDTVAVASIQGTGTHVGTIITNDSQSVTNLALVLTVFCDWFPEAVHTTVGFYQLSQCC